jgi:large subunit ribosomal protein L24
MAIKKGDTVLVTKGADAGKKAKVLKVIAREGKILLEDINLKKDHQKARQSDKKGQVVAVAHPISIANVKAA